MVSTEFQESFKRASRELQKSFKRTSKEFQESFMIFFCSEKSPRKEPMPKALVVFFYLKGEKVH